MHDLKHPIFIVLILSLFALSACTFVGVSTPSNSTSVVSVGLGSSYISVSSGKAAALSMEEYHARIRDQQRRESRELMNQIREATSHPILSQGPYQEGPEAPLSDQAHIRILNQVGDIQVMGWNKNKIQLTVTKFAKNHKDLAQLRFEYSYSHDEKDQDDHVTLKTILPESGEGRINYTLYVPRGSYLKKIQTQKGNINIENIAGQVMVESRDGNINVTRSMGLLDLVTRDGKIKVRDFSGTALLLSEKGAIDIEMNGFHRYEGLDHVVKIQSTEGNIRTAFVPDLAFQLVARGAPQKLRTEFDSLVHSPGLIQGWVGNPDEGLNETVNIFSESGTIDILKK